MAVDEKDGLRSYRSYVFGLTASHDKTEKEQWVLRRLKKSKEKKVNCYSLESTNTQRVVIEGQLQKRSLCL